MSIRGRWHITEMQLWDQDAIDLLGPAFIEIGPGNDEGDPANGRGWAISAGDGSLAGRISFHGGDDSAFRAVRD